MRLKYLLAIGCMLLAFSSGAQNRNVFIQPVYDTIVRKVDTPMADSFCVILMQLVSDAPSDFSRTRCKLIKVGDEESNTWSCNIGLPGAVNSIVGRGYGISGYYGIIYEGSSTDSMYIFYNKYKKLLGGCASANGLLTVKQTMEGVVDPVTNEVVKVNPKLENYPGISYQEPSKDRQDFCIYVEYNDKDNIYTLEVMVLYWW